MTAWSQGKSPYRFICYYLEAPCHTQKMYKPWSGHRELLDQLGWGFIVTYLGRQASGCGATHLSRESGLADGADAVAKTRAEGFPAGTIVFLDVEAIQNAAEVTPYLAYFKGWTAAVIASEFKSGIYCTMANRMPLAVASNAEYLARDPIGLDTAAFWIVSLTSKFSLTAEPTGCGVPYAQIWQGRFDVTNEMHNGVSIPVIDLNVATSADPSRARMPRPATT